MQQDLTEFERALLERAFDAEGAMAVDPIDLRRLIETIWQSRTANQRLVKKVQEMEMVDELLGT